MDILTDQKFWQAGRQVDRLFAAGSDGRNLCRPARLPKSLNWIFSLWKTRRLPRVFRILSRGSKERRFAPF